MIGQQLLQMGRNRAAVRVKGTVRSTQHVTQIVCAEQLIHLDVDIGLWHYELWSFKIRDAKLERFLHKNQLTQRKLLNFQNWTNGEPL